LLPNPGTLFYTEPGTKEGDQVFRKAFLPACVLVLAIASSFLSAQQSKDRDKQNRDDDKFYHGTGINDLNAIGSRNVGCNRGLGNWYTLDTQVKMGQEFARQVEQTSRVITDPFVNEVINRLAQNLQRNSDTHLPLTVKILDVEDVNAFALPGGYMFVNAGAILLADDESELAGVMAHEIGHVAACHAARESTRGALAQIAMIPVIIMTGGLAGVGVSEGANYGIPAVFSKFGRSFEAQADYLGVQYTYKAGYDPNGMINFFEKLQAMEKKRPGVYMKLYGDHPQTPDRIAKSQEEIGKILPPREQYIIDTSDFQLAKKRLALIMKHRLKEDKSNETPELRRTATDKDPDKTDDRPVIKRAAGK
jgi:predicted Zn-dependent protease